MTDLEALFGGVDLRGGASSPLDIARYVTSHIINYPTLAHGYPPMSPVGLRLIHGLSAKQQDTVLAKDTDYINEFVEKDIQEHGNDSDTAIHFTWRHARRVQQFIDDSHSEDKSESTHSVTPLERDFVIADSPKIKWSVIESAFRESAGILLSRYVARDENGLYVGIPMPSCEQPGTVASTTAMYGDIAVKNCVRYDQTGTIPTVSSYLFEKLPVVA